MSKHNPLIDSTDVFKYIAKQSSLTREQVKECFRTYGNLLRAITESEDRPKNLIVYLPNIGRFEFVKVNGRKKGHTYSIPRNGKLETVVMEEDEPDYEKLMFRIKGGFKDNTKKSIKNKNRKQQEFNNIDFNKTENKTNE